MTFEGGFFLLWNRPISIKGRVSAAKQPKKLTMFFHRALTTSRLFCQ
ncbi:hypothetical protein SD78_4069 [Bacillus badius]|nr:hypothetical protein SD78_4069 [Bacillus badius]